MKEQTNTGRTEANKGRSEGEHPLAMGFIEDPGLLCDAGHQRLIAAELNRLQAIDHDPMRKAAPAMFEALEAQAKHEAECQAVNDAVPDGEKPSKRMWDSITVSGTRARKLRDSALSQARGEAADA